MQGPHLTNLRLLVDDYPAAFRFYRDVLGLAAVWGDETSNYADFDVGTGCRLALFERVGMADVLTLDPPGDRVVLVFSVQDVDAATALLRETGAAVVAEPTDRPAWGIRTAHVRDPEGNLIELYSELPQETWSEELRSENARFQSS
jgi:predicted enzyme related to lactoylglutathione lyase